MTNMLVFRFSLAIPADDYLAYYQQKAKQISVRAENGQTIHFPANQIQRFLKHEGIYGRFEMRCDGNFKFHDIKRCD